MRLEGGPADRQWPFAAHEQRSTFPHRGLRKRFHERAHEQLVLRLRPMTDPLQHDPIVIEDAPREPEVLDRVEQSGAGVNRLDDVRRQHVVAVPRRQQVVASVVDAKPHVRLAQHVVVRVREVRRALAYAVRQFDDVDACPACRLTAPAVAPPPRPMTSTRAGRRCSTIGRWPISRCVRSISGLSLAWCKPVEEQHEPPSRLPVHADRGLNALVAPEDALDAGRAGVPAWRGTDPATRGIIRRNAMPMAPLASERAPPIDRDRRQREG